MTEGRSLVPPIRGISIVVPAYNAAATVVESVTSAVASADALDDAEVEIVVVDDGSTDDTAAVVERAFADEKRVRVYRHRENRGGAAARNTAVDRATHDWLYCLDSDNLLDPASLRRIVAMAETGDWDIVAPAETRYFASVPTEPIHHWFWDRETLELADVLRMYETPVACGNYLFSLDIWVRSGGYPEFAGSLDAWGFGVRALFEGARFGVCAGSFYLHRQGHDSYYMRDTDSRRSLAAAQILLPYVGRLAADDRERLLAGAEILRYFENLPSHPLHLDGESAFPSDPGGRVVVARPAAREVNGSGRRAMPARARDAARRAWVEYPPRTTVRRLRRSFGQRPGTDER